MQESYSTTGRIHALPPSEQRGEYTTRQCILEVDGYKDRKEYGVFEFFQKAVPKLDGFRTGETASVQWNLKGRAANNGKFYTTLSAFRIDRVPSQAASTPQEDYERNRKDQAGGHPVPKSPPVRNYQEPRSADDDICF